MKPHIASVPLQLLMAHKLGFKRLIESLIKLFVMETVSFSVT